MSGRSRSVPGYRLHKQSGQAVVTLARGRTDVRESEPVRPVPEAFVRAVLPHVLPPVAAMIELQLLTGARPGELCVMRACDLDTAGGGGFYRPARPKSSRPGTPRGGAPRPPRAGGGGGGFL